MGNQQRSQGEDKLQANYPGSNDRSFGRLHGQPLAGKRIGCLRRQAGVKKAGENQRQEKNPNRQCNVF
jgi:hypothetical protein